MAPEYNAEIQARIPAALCTIYNVIQEFDESEGKLPPDNNSFEYVGGDDDPGGSGSDESDARRDRRNMEGLSEGSREDCLMRQKRNFLTLMSGMKKIKCVIKRSLSQIILMAGTNTIQQGHMCSKVNVQTY